MPVPRVAWLDGVRVPLLRDECDVTYVEVPALGGDVCVTDGLGGVMAFVSYGPDGPEALDLPVSSEVLDGVPVAVVETGAGRLVLLAADVVEVRDLLAVSRSA